MSVFFSRPEFFKSQVEVAGCYCIYQGTFLLLKRDPRSSQGSTWGVPAGKVEKGETLEEGAVRELKEETGLVLTPDELSLKGTAYVRNDSFEYCFHLYCIEFKEKPKEITLNKEHTEYKWVTIEEASKLPLIGGAKALLDFVFNNTASA